MGVGADYVGSRPTMASPGGGCPGMEVIPLLFGFFALPEQQKKSQIAAQNMTMCSQNQREY